MMTEDVQKSLQFICALGNGQNVADVNCEGGKLQESKPCIAQKANCGNTKTIYYKKPNVAIKAILQNMII